MEWKAVILRAGLMMKMDLGDKTGNTITYCVRGKCKMPFTTGIFESGQKSLVVEVVEVVEAGCPRPIFLLGGRQ